VRLRNPGARPPELQVERTAKDALRISYRSARRMCGIARGIVLGLAGHFGERVRIEEPSCMLRGADRCEIDVALEAAAAQ
jgi:predicted hydrocarbon binding protein